MAASAGGWSASGRAASTADSERETMPVLGRVDADGAGASTSWLRAQADARASMGGCERWWLLGRAAALVGITGHAREVVRAGGRMGPTGIGWNAGGWQHRLQCNCYVRIGQRGVPRGVGS